MSHYYPQTRIESHDAARARLSALRLSLESEEEFNELTVEGRTKADCGCPHPLLIKSPPADCRLPANPCTDAMEAKTGERAAGTDSAPEPAPVVGAAGGAMDGVGLCIIGCNIYQTHKLVWSTGRCERCNWEYPKLLHL